MLMLAITTSAGTGIANIVFPSYIVKRFGE